MMEKRGAKRLPITLDLEVSSLFKQDDVKVDVNAPIHVTDISKTGIGFTTENALPIGYYFNAKITMGNQESSLYCVVKIVREQPMEGSQMKYGCEFVGLAPILNFIFDEYEAMQERGEASQKA